MKAQNVEKLSHQTNRLTMPVVILHLLVIGGSAIQLIEARKIHINMPNVRPEHDENYLCTAHKLPASQGEEYIVSFQPNATATKVHHLIIYGCRWPGALERDSPHYVWDCGEMGRNNDDEDAGTYDAMYQRGPICAPDTDTSIMYSWALDAQALDLPKGVGFKIGGRSNVHFIVLQVHYGHINMFTKNPTLTDNSGITLRTVPGSDPTIDKEAGVLLLASHGFVNRGEVRHEISCVMKEEGKTIYPFRFRIHTHKLGTKVSGYKVGKDGKLDKKILIGERNPQLPQMFYPIKDKKLSLTKGESVLAFCDFNNTRGNRVKIGSTAMDEMCNFYLMYWTRGETLKQKICTQANPIRYF